jgi:zinc protease
MEKRQNKYDSVALIFRSTMKFYRLPLCRIKIHGGMAQMGPEKKVFDNGLTLLVQPMASRQTVSFQWWVRAGSGDESLDQRGAAHFLEHMLFTQGATSAQTNVYLLQEMERLGGYANAFTTYDHTGYECCVPAIHWVKGLNWLMEVLGQLDVHPQEFLKEKEVVAQEQRDDQQQPSVQFEEQLWQRTCPLHPMGQPILGKPEQIQALTPDAIETFYQTHYQPNQMILSVAGPVTLAEIERELLPNIDHWKNKDVERRAPSMQEAFKAQDWTWHHGQHEHLVQWLWPIVGYGHPDVPGLEWLASVLGGGSHAWLHAHLRLQRNWVRSIRASVFLTDWGGLFVIDAYPLPNRVDQVVDQVEAMLRAPETIPKEMLAYAAADLEKEYIYSLDTTTARAKMNITFEMFFGGASHQHAYYQNIQHFQLEDAMAWVQKYLHGPHAKGQWLPEKPSC